MEATDTIDLSSCDREPIHLLGAIQPFGYLFAFSYDWLLTNVSANVGSILPVAPDAALGNRADNFFEETFLSELRQICGSLVDHDGSVERMFGCRALGGATLYDVAISRNQSRWIVELEPHVVHAYRKGANSLRAALRQFENSSDLSEFLQHATETVAEMTGFDRIMLYRFHPDNSGEVVAETLNSNVDSFLGLRYPASDIPSQARALYLLNYTRLIHSVDDERIPILPPAKSASDNLDLSQSALRSVSEMHIEYLRNMGVKATMSVSVVINGRLWGLFACHHYAPLHVPLELRSMAELFGETFALELSSRLRDEAQVNLDDARRLHMRMVSTMQADKSVHDNVAAHIDTIKMLVPCDTAVLWVDDKVQVSGKPISEEDLQVLIMRLNRMAPEKIIHTSNLGEFLDTSLSIVERYAGMLVVPISRKPRDFLIFLRTEELQTVSWAGNPEKPVELGPNGARLTPRQSFETWRELRHGYSLQWTDAEVGMAEQIRQVLLELIIRNVDERARVLAEAREQQDLLVHELNHRVRNVLGLINSVVARTAESATDIDAFKTVLGGRIQSLATAQTMLSERNWNHTPLHDLIDLELAPYREGNQRIVIDGPPVSLAPKAFTTITLVIHELVTNAVKHGALSTSSGSLAIRWSLSPVGTLVIAWEESGVVINEYPRRKGFGSVIIGRSIPHDLNGSADIEYALNGLIARFEIPANFVTVGDVDPEAISEGEHAQTPITAETQRAQSVDGKRILIVEDNMIIALDLERELTTFGLEFFDTAATVAEALKLIDQVGYDGALLDVNLGKETSLPLAKKLRSLGVPFIFITGYSESARKEVSEMDDVTVLNKPLAHEKLRIWLQESDLV